LGVGDVIDVRNQTACAKFLGDPEKIFIMGGGKTTIVKDIEEAKIKLKSF